MALKGKTLLAYVAGIIDGEGNIGLYKLRKSSAKCGYSYIMCVRVVNTQPWLIRFLQLQFEGYVQNVKPMASSRKPLWRWEIRAKKAESFLKLVLPYLQLKRQQAEIAIQFQSRQYQGKKSTDEEKAVMEAQHLLMCNLNQRGVRAIES